MATTYDVGDTVKVTAAFLNGSAVAADPTKVYFSLQKPAGTITYSTYAAGTTAIIRSAAGSYYKEIICTGTGMYEYRWHSTGTVHTAEEGYFPVRVKRVV